MELALGIVSAIRVLGPRLGLRLRSAGPRVDLERNKLLRFDSFCKPGTDWKDVSLLMRLSRPADASTAEDVVGVEAAVVDADGGLGNGTLERREPLFEKDAWRNRLVVA
jgi:hypothetical protein